MKRLLVISALVMAFSMSVSAQLRFGVKAGVDFNSLDVTNVLHEKENSTGYTGGLMLEYTMPRIGIGFDASLMLTHGRSPKSVHMVAPDGTAMVEASMADKNYFEVPLNIKYAFNFPAVSSIVKPFVATGPSVAFDLSDKETTFDINKTIVSWNLGAGVELVKHIQVGVGYRWELGSINKNDMSFITGKYNLKNNGWRITAAYLF